jgi:hypothetical protein
MCSTRRGVTETSGGPTRTSSAHAISAPRLEGRQPDVAAIQAVLATMPPPPNPKLVAAGTYDLKDREIAAEVDAIAFAISVRREAGLLIAEAERNDLQPAS